MAVLEFLWFALTSPWWLMPFFWPVFVVPAAMALAFALVIRAWTYRSVGKDRAYRLMQSTLGWPVFVVAWTVVIVWVGIAVTVGALTLAAMTRT